LIEVILEIL